MKDRAMAEQLRQFVCPHCLAANRVPAEKDALLAKCGKCHELLFTGEPIDVSAEQLARHGQGTRGAALLLDVWAPWCGPCRAMAPQFKAAAARLEPRVRLLKLNSDVEQQASAELGVRGIPALFLFRDGKVIAQTTGSRSADQLVAWTEQQLAGAPAP